MLTRAGRKIRHHPGRAINFRLLAVQLAEPKRGKGNHERDRPFRTVQHPTGKETALRDVSRAAGDPKRLARRFFADFPNESVVIKMQQAGSGNDASKNTLYGFEADV